MKCVDGHCSPPLQQNADKGTVPTDNAIELLHGIVTLLRNNAPEPNSNNKNNFNNECDNDRNAPPMPPAVTADTPIGPGFMHSAVQYTFSLVLELPESARNTEFGTFHLV